MQLDLVQLRTFVAVAEEQHLTRAADRLHISQSAASGQIRSLEAALGVQLFTRASRNLRLTRAGELLRREAEVLLNQAGLFTSFARELRGCIEGRLVVGSNSDLNTRIGRVIQVLRSSHPLVTVDLHGRPYSGTLQGLMNGELDIGVLLGRPLESELTYYELTKVHFRTAGPAAWKTEIEQADWQQLAALPWIAPMGNSAYSAALTELFERRGLKLNTVVRFNSAAHERLMLQSGIGMMFTREELALQGEREGYLAISPLCRQEFSLSIAHLASRGKDPLIQAFIEATQTVWPEVDVSGTLREAGA